MDFPKNFTFFGAPIYETRLLETNFLKILILGLLLKEEMSVELCVSCRDKPTVNLLEEVGQLLNKHAAGKF